MKILILPDVHNKIQIVDEILERERGYDKVIFLGDYFDHFNDTAEVAKGVAEWLKPKLYDKNMVFLFGNHDISYAFNQYCSGWAPDKADVIHRILKREDWLRMRFFYQAQGWLFTHAGLHPHYLPPLWKDADVTTANIRKYLTEESGRCLSELERGGEHWFYRCGDSRRRVPIGIEQGGILWCDVRSEFQPIPNISQIFGHTVSRPYPTLVGEDLKRINSIEVVQGFISPKDRWNVDLDCHLAYYGVLEDGKLAIERSPLH